MRAPRRKRPLPRTIAPPPDGANIDDIASRVSYVGSPEHKSGPSFAGQPKPRADATICDSSLNGRQADINVWLRNGIELQCFGYPWEGDFPRYVWSKVEEKVYEARLVNRQLGQYKGWELSVEEWPSGIDDLNWE